MQRIPGFLCVCFLTAASAFPQRISFGIVGGTNLSPNFPGYHQTFQGGGPNPSGTFHYLSGARSFILGALIEGRLSDRFSIEANVLHRPMKNLLVSDLTFSDGHTEHHENSFTAVRAWEFPVMFKYTMPTVQALRLRPFIEAGPAFRTQEDATASEPSQYGVAVGAGVAFHFNRFRVAPTLRYTRWARDRPFPNYATRPDQLEFLTSLSYATEPGERRIGTRKLEIGGIVGTSLTAGIANKRGETKEETPYLAGLSLQLPVRGSVSMEVNGIYRPFQLYTPTYRATLLTWQFPVLAKYRWTRATWTPFIAAGPSFRLSGNLNGYDPSHFGVTAGAGIERLFRGVRFAPTVRYTRWQKDASRIPAFLNPPYTGVNPNSVEVMLGISF